MLKVPAISIYRHSPTVAEVGLWSRNLGLVLLALAVGSATLTFDWIIEHQPDLNYVGEFAGAVLYPSDFLLVAGLAFWTVGWFLSPGLKLRYGPLYVLIPLLLLVALTGFSGLWATYEALAGFSALRRLLLLGLYLVMVTDGVRALVPMVVALFGFGLLHAGVGLAQVLAESTVGLSSLGELTEAELIVGGIGNPRAYGLGFNPNPIGLFLSVVAILAYGLFLLKRLPLPTMALCSGIFGVTFLGLIVTASRSALMGWLLAVLVVTILAWLWAGENRSLVLKRLAIAAVVLVAAVGMVGPISYVSGLPKSTAASPQAYEILGNVSNRIYPDVISRGITGRVSDWELNGPVIRKHWVLGVGAGNAPVALKENYFPDRSGSFFVPPHNVLLLVWTELGVLGGAAWGLIMVAPLVWLISNRLGNRIEPDALLWLGPLVVILLVSLLEFSPWATQDARLLMPAILGLWAGRIVADTKEGANQVGRRDGTPLLSKIISASPRT